MKVKELIKILQRQVDDLGAGDFNVMVMEPYEDGNLLEVEMVTSHTDTKTVIIDQW